MNDDKICTIDIIIALLRIGLESVREARGLSSDGSVLLCSLTQSALKDVHTLISGATDKRLGVLVLRLMERLARYVDTRDAASLKAIEEDLTDLCEGCVEAKELIDASEKTTQARSRLRDASEDKD
jgi:hypothetical protein